MMGPIRRCRVFLLTSLLLLPASRVRADEDYARYSAEVCNRGAITVDVATAYRDSDAFSEYWVIERWTHVAPGACETVFDHLYPTQMLIQGMFGLTKHPVHLAFAFTDSTGMWGAARVEPPDGTAASHLQLCVNKNDNKYRVDARDPATGCGTSGFLIPASIDYEPTAGDPVNPVTGNYYPSPEIRVALDPNARAIRLGSQTSASAAAPTGAIPKALGKGTRTARLISANVVAWTSGDDRRWYYENGSLVPDLFKLTGVEESPLFDTRLKGERMFKSGELFEKFNALETQVQKEVRKRPGAEFTFEVGNWACGVYEGTYDCVHLDALDFDKAEVIGSAGSRSLLIPCVRGIVRGGDPYGDNICAIRATEWKASDGPKNKTAFLGRDMDAVTDSDIILPVASDESATIIRSALAGLAAEERKYYEPDPVVVR